MRSLRIPLLPAILIPVLMWDHLQNPWKDHPRSINPPQRASYPAEFKKLFEGPDAPRGGYMWIPPREPALLDYKDALFILIGRSPNLGLSLSLCSPPPFHSRARAAQCCGAVSEVWHRGS